MESFEPVTRLTRDIIKAVRSSGGSGGMSGTQEIRYLVDAYYQMQHFRIATENQIRSMDQSESKEPHLIIDWMTEQMHVMEKQVERALAAYTTVYEHGKWLNSIKGIGPVLSANFIAELDVTKTQTAGGFWRFAGLDPSMEWKKGEKRPWNGRLKTACWKASDSWVKLKNHEDSFYSKIYVQRKEQEIERNEAGLFADQAKMKLEKFKIGKDTDAYKAYSAGKLPPAHLEQRARRYAAKLFLSHLFEVMYYSVYREAPPNPFAIEHRGHVHKIEVPNWPF